MTSAFKTRLLHHQAREIYSYTLIPRARKRKINHVEARAMLLAAERLCDDLRGMLDEYRKQSRQAVETKGAGTCIKNF